MGTPVENLNFAEVKTSADVLTFESGYFVPASLSHSLYSVQYGIGGDLNIDLSAYPTFEIGILEAVLPTVDATTVWDLTVNGVAVSAANVAADKVSWHQSQFGGGVDFSDVDTIQFSLTYTPHVPVLADAVRVQMTEFRAVVPEPSATAVFFGFGLIGLCRRKRKKA